MTDPGNDLDTAATREAAGGACFTPHDLGPDPAWALLIAARRFIPLGRDAVADLPGGQRGHLVLASIARSQAPSQLALARQLEVDKTAMTYLLDTLTEAGFILRRRDPADRRARRIELTPAGRDALTLFNQRLEAAVATLLAPLDPQEATTFTHLLDRIARAAQTDANPPRRSSDS